MGNLLRIYSGAGAQVNLYDSTNGVLHCGFCLEDITGSIDPNLVGISDSNKIQINEIGHFEVPLAQSDATLLAALMSRIGILQEVYIIGIDFALKIADTYVSVKGMQSFKAEDVHSLVLAFDRMRRTRTPAADLPESNYIWPAENILGAFGSFEVDGGGGIGAGWANTGAGGLSIDTSHLGGGYGDEQRLTLADAGDWLACRIRFPLDQLRVKMTISANVNDDGGGGSTYQIGLVTKDSDGNVLDTNLSGDLSLGASASARNSYIADFTPSADAQYIEARIQGSAADPADLGVDNFMIEMGNLTDYLES